MSTLLIMWATLSVGFLLGWFLRPRRTVIEHHRHYHIKQTDPNHERFKIELN